MKGKGDFYLPFLSFLHLIFPFLITLSYYFSYKHEFYAIIEEYFLSLSLSFPIFTFFWLPFHNTIWRKVAVKISEISRKNAKRAKLIGTFYRV